MTNNFKILVFATILCSMAMGCSTKWTQAIRYGNVANTENKETVEIEINKKLIIVPVYLGGKKYRFLFDTGAPFSISKALQNNNDFELVSKGNIRDSDHNRKKVHWVKVDSIRVGSVLFTNQTAFVGDFEANPILRCLKVDGIIGSNLIRHCNWTIDQEHQTLSLFDSIEKEDLKECTIVPFRTDNQYNMFIDVNFGSAKVKNVLVDYGSNGSVALNNSIFSTLKDRQVISDPFLETGLSQSGIIGKPINFQRKLSFSDSAKINKLMLRHVVVRTGKTVSVGNNLLSRFRVTIDWENKNLYLTKAHKVADKIAVSNQTKLL